MKTIRDNPATGVGQILLSSRTTRLLLALAWTWATGGVALWADSAAAANPPLSEGAVFPCGGKRAKLNRVEMLPLIENDYTRRFKYDRFDNPKLGELRARFGLDAVVAPGRGEFARQRLLLDWVHRQFKRFGRPTTSAHGALEILSAIEEGHAFFCQQYAELMVSAAASLGWVDRPLALRRHQGVAKVGGSTEHSVTEIWSNQHRKWVMFDPTTDLHVERDGRPLSAYEIRQEWFYREGADLVFVVGQDQRRCRKADLPVVLRTFPEFGDLALYPDEMDKYGFIGFIPNTDLMDSGYDYAGMFIVKDALCDGTRWHERSVPLNPAVEPYFPLGQTALTLRSEGQGVRVSARTLTPNFQGFEQQLDGGAWRACGNESLWWLHPGVNRLAMRTVNRFGVVGPTSTAEVEVGSE